MRGSTPRLATKKMTMQGTMEKGGFYCMGREKEFSGQGKRFS